MDKPIACRCGAELLLQPYPDREATWLHPMTLCALSYRVVRQEQVSSWNTLMDDTPAMTLAANAMKEKAASKLFERAATPNLSTDAASAYINASTLVGDIDTAMIAASPFRSEEVMP